MTSGADALIESFCTALAEEIAFQSSQGGRPYPISGGHLLSQGTEGMVYFFTLEADAVLPEGVPVRVHYGSYEVKGEIITIQGFELILVLEEYIGDTIEQAELFSDPWFLLVALQERLQETHRRNLALALEVVLPKDSDIYGTGYNLPDAARRVNFVWGPPGTGKTENLARLVRNFYEKGLTVLVVSNTNIAVDEALERAFLYLGERAASGDIVRYGFARLPSICQSDLLASNLAAKIRPDLKVSLLELEASRKALLSRYLAKKKAPTGRMAASPVQAQLKELSRSIQAVRNELKVVEAKIAAGARVLGCTLAKAAIDPVVYEKTFDVVLLDEASMAYIPQAFFAASLARKKIIISGDFRQLAPVALANTPLVEQWLKRDVFEQAGIISAVESGRNPGLVILSEQRRMHPLIAGFVNNVVYGGLLRDVPETSARQKIADVEPWPQQAVVLVDVSGLPAFCYQKMQSRFNPFTALLSISLASSAYQGGLTVALLTPYALQARLLRTICSEFFQQSIENPVLAATVHRFQGAERDVVILDCVDSFRQKKAGLILTSSAHSASLRLINVAVTRARGKLVVLAHRTFLESRLPERSVLLSLFSYIERYGKVIRAEDLMGLNSKVAGLTWCSARWSAFNQWTADLKKAGEIQLDWPAETGNFAPAVLHSLKQAVQKGARVIIRAGNPDAVPAELRPYTVRHPSAWNTCTAVDRFLLWYGFPWPDDDRVDHLCARLVGEKSCRFLMSLLGMDLREIKKAGCHRYAGLQAYVENTFTCPCCRKPLTIRFGPQRKPFLGCTGYGNCQQPPLSISEDIMNMFLSIAGITCPQGHLMTARLTPKGPLAVCTHQPSCRYTLTVRDLL